MDVNAISQNASASCEKLGQKSFFNVPLETCDPRFLDVTESTLDMHVAIQPTAIAFFGNLRKLSQRSLERAKRRYERWLKVKFHEVKSGATEGKRQTIAEVEASVVIRFRAEIEKYEEELDQLQDGADTLDAWYQAWLQKSHTIREYANMMSEELNTAPYVMQRQSQQSQVERQSKSSAPKKSLKEVLKERKENQSQEGGS